MSQKSFILLLQCCVQPFQNCTHGTTSFCGHFCTRFCIYVCTFSARSIQKETNYRSFWWVKLFVINIGRYNLLWKCYQNQVTAFVFNFLAWICTHVLDVNLNFILCFCFYKGETCTLPGWLPVHLWWRLQPIEICCYGKKNPFQSRLRHQYSYPIQIPTKICKGRYQYLKPYVYSLLFEEFFWVIYFNNFDRLHQRMFKHWLLVGFSLSLPFTTTNSWNTNLLFWHLHVCTWLSWWKVVVHGPPHLNITQASS